MYNVAIDYAFEVAMEKHENDEDSLIYDMLRRSREMWKTIRINWLDNLGLTYEDFCKQCEEKQSIVFLSNDDVDDFNKALEIMNIIRR